MQLAALLYQARHDKTWATLVHTIIGKLGNRIPVGRVPA